MAKTNAISINDMARAFGVSTMTLYLWRKGTPTKEKLPHEVEKVGSSDRISFTKSKVTAWAKKHGLALDFDRKEPATPAPGPVKKVPPKRAKVKH